MVGRGDSRLDLALRVSEVVRLGRGFEQPLAAACRIGNVLLGFRVGIGDRTAGVTACKRGVPRERTHFFARYRCNRVFLLVLFPVKDNDFRPEHLEHQPVVITQLIEKAAVCCAALFLRRDGNIGRIKDQLQLVSACNGLRDLFQRDLFPVLRALGSRKCVQRRCGHP